VPLRRQSSEILYPFTPDAETYRNALSGVVDAFFVVKGLGTSGPYLDDSTSSSTIDIGWPISKPYFGALYSMEITALASTYVFYVKAPDNFWQLLTFDVTRGQGLVRVTSNEDSFSFIIINSDAMYDTVGTTTEMWVELEPSRIVYQLDEIRSVRLTNEYREHDTRIRPESVEDHTDVTVFLLDDPTQVLQLVDGYNCALHYDDDTETLTITADPGLGKGKPLEFPWDSDAIDVFSGIKSVNAQNVDGNLEIEFGKSIVPAYGTNSLTMHIKED